MREGVYFYKDWFPEVDETAFIAHGARVVGNVRLAAGSSVWHNAVLRGDLARIEVGEGSNIQDCSVLHVNEDGGCTVGKGVTVGHGCVLHACRVEDGALVGMGSIVLSGAVVGAGALVAAGSLLREGTVVGPGELWAGRPARRVRAVTDEQREYVRRAGRLYEQLGEEYQT